MVIIASEIICLEGKERRRSKERNAVFQTQSEGFNVCLLVNTYCDSLVFNYIPLETLVCMYW